MDDRERNECIINHCILHTDVEHIESSERTFSQSIERIREYTVNENCKSNFCQNRLHSIEWLMSME